MKKILLVSVLLLSPAAHAYFTLSEAPGTVSIKEDAGNVTITITSGGTTYFSKPVTFGENNAEWQQAGLSVSLVNPVTGARVGPRYTYKIFMYSPISRRMDISPGRGQGGDSLQLVYSYVEQIIPGGDGPVCYELHDGSGSKVNVNEGACVYVSKVANCNLTMPGTINLVTLPTGDGTARASGQTNLTFSCNTSVSATLELTDLSCAIDDEDGAPICDPGHSDLVVSSPSWPWGTSKTGDRQQIQINADYSGLRPNPGLYKWTYLITAKYD